MRRAEVLRRMAKMQHGAPAGDVAQGSSRVIVVKVWDTASAGSSPSRCGTGLQPCAQRTVRVTRAVAEEPSLATALTVTVFDPTVV